MEHGEHSTEVVSEGSAAVLPASEENKVLGTRYTPRHLSEKEPKEHFRKVNFAKWTRRIGVPLAGIAVALVGFGSAAFAEPVHVVHGNTFSGLVWTHCGTSDWQSVAFPGRDKNKIYAGETIDITCPTAAKRPAAKPVNPAPAQHSKTTTQAPVSTGWIHPLSNGARGSGGGCFGSYRATPWVHYHQGVDLMAPSGMAIRAVHSGRVVVRAYQSGGAGNYIAIDHGDGYQTVYMHLIRPGLAVGTWVNTGDTIGYVGATGDAKGPHLHFEVHHGLWNHIDPASFMRARGVNIGC